MSRAFLFTLPFAGHINPALALTRHLVAAGEDITVYSSDEFEPNVARSGARFRAYSSPTLRAFTEIWLDGSETGEQRPSLGRFTRLLAEAHLETLETDLGPVREAPPDYILHDALARWGWSIATILARPAVSLGMMFLPCRETFRLGRRSGFRPGGPRMIANGIVEALKAIRIGSEVRRRHGVENPKIGGLFFGFQPLTIVFTSRELHPPIGPMDDRFFFAGPEDVSDPDEPSFPMELIENRRVVLISLGTVFNRDREVFRICFEALSGLDSMGVVSTGRGLRPEELGPAPPNVIVRDFVPQAEVLKRSRLFINHGGIGSLGKGFLSGSPAIIVPATIEQAIVGARVAELGAGLVIHRHRLTARTLRESVETILNDARFASSATTIGDSLRAAPGMKNTAERILEYVGRNPLQSGE